MINACQFQLRHRHVQSNYASHKLAGSEEANYPPRRSYYQLAPMGRIVGFFMLIARGGACASNRQ
jgi:hypothetical protein